MKNENGIEKSAILTGQTLVNLFRINEEKTSSGAICRYKNGKLQFIFGSNWDYSYTSGINTLQDCLPLVNGKKYYYRLELSRTPLSTVAINSYNTTTHSDLYRYATYRTENSNQTLFTGTFIANEHNRVGVHIVDEMNGETITGTFMVLEYQDGMENWDIPYFEGMQSVQTPSLTTTGKNLLDGDIPLNYVGDASIKNMTRIEKGKTYTYSNNKLLTFANRIAIRILDKNGAMLDSSTTPITIVRDLYYNSGAKCYTSNADRVKTDSCFISNIDGYVRFGFFSYPSEENRNLYFELQLEEGSTATSYEPFKSNILTVNEDVTLRSVGDVQDTLDLMTGEVTESIGEIVLDGTQDMSSDSNGVYIQVNDVKRFLDYTGKIACDKLPVMPTYGLLANVENGISGFTNRGSYLGQNWLYVRINNSVNKDEVKEWLTQNPITVQYQRVTDSIKTVDLTIVDQDNQPQEHMKLFPSGYINTSSSTFPPILELKGITHNNKLNMTTTNGTNNTQLTTLDNLALDGIICYDGIVVRDSYDVESGLYTKRVFRFTIDEEFIERYRGKFSRATNNNILIEMNIDIVTNCGYPSTTTRGISNNIEYSHSGNKTRISLTSSGLWFTLVKEELTSYDVDGLLDWIRRNGTIEVAYQMATPQIIHMQPNMQPYVSTRPYQGSIESQGNILESSFLDYTSEQSIISPKPLGDGDVLRWEQGSQCYVYENDKEYIPLTDYNQPMGTVLDLEEEDGEQFVENLDGGDIIVDVPFKEKAVYERHLVSHEDNVIYPTQDKLDPTGKIEVDYICGATWQNPNDLSDIRHVGTLREDGRYDVTIRRSGDDEIRLMDGATNIGLDGDGLNPSEFELTYFNSGGVEVGKYGDTSHTLEDCVLDSKLETGMVYGETLVNVFNYTPEEMATWKWSSKDSGGVAIWGDSGYMTKAWAQIQAGKTYTMIYVNAPSHYLGFYAVRTFIDGYSQTQGKYSVFTVKDDYVEGTKANFYLKSSQGFTDEELANIQIIVVEGDYTSYPMDIPYFEGVDSTIVNGFTTVGKNLWNGDQDLVVATPSNNVVGVFTKDFTLPKGKYYATGIQSTMYNTPAHVRLYSDIASRSVDIPLNRTDYYMDVNFDVEKITVYANGYQYQSSLDKELIIKNFMISRIEDGLEYEPPKTINYTLPTPITLNKVGDVADTYDVVSGVETRNVEIADMANRTSVISSSSNDYPDVVGMSMECGNSDIIIINGSFSDIGIPTIAKDICQGAVPTQNTEGIGYYYNNATKKTAIKMIVNKTRLVNDGYTGDTKGASEWIKVQTFKIYGKKANPQTIQHTLIPSTVETMQEPTFILPQPLRSVPNGICDRLYWDENKGHYCIEKRVERFVIDGSDDERWVLHRNSSSGYPYYYGLNSLLKIQNTGNNSLSSIFLENFKSLNGISSIDSSSSTNEGVAFEWGALYLRFNANKYSSIVDLASFKTYFNANPMNLYYPLSTPQIIDLPHLNKKLILPTQPDTLPIGYKVESQVNNPQLGLTIPYKQLNYPSRPQNIDFKMDIADYVLTWDDVKEARQYNVILNDRVIATVKEPQWNSGEEMYGYIMVEAQNELAENLSEELYIKTVPNAPAQLTVGHNPMTNYYDFEISFIKTSAIAEYYTVQYRIDNGEWVYKTIQSDEIDPNSKVLWRFSIYEINEQIEVWATATNEIGTNDILPTAIYYMSPTPQWTYRVNSKELFVRWMDESPYDTQYKLRYQYKSDGIYRYAYFEGDKQEIGKLYEALIPLADDEEVSIALCVISEKENLYTKPIKASKELDPNIKPPKNFNYHWLARGLIEFYWEDNYDVDVEYEAIVEHRLTSGNNEWITDTRIFSATDTEGTGTVYRLSYQLEDLEEIRVKVRMKWAMNETEWSESLTTVFIPVEGNPPQWIRRTQTQEGLLVEWEAQEYVDSYHVYVMSNGEELQHLETMDNFIYVDLDYSNTIDIEIYEATRFSGGIQSDPTDKMCFRPTMDKHQLIHDVVTPDTLTYEIEVDTIQKGIKERQVIHDINTTPKVTSKQPMDVAISSPFTLSFHPLQLDVHQAGAKYYGDTELHIKTLDVKSRDSIEVLTFERITDQYGVDFTVYTPSASKYPITLEVNRVRIVCFGDSLTSGHPGFWE